MSTRASIQTHELIDRCQKQERSAQEEFYRRYRQEVARIAFKVLGPDADLDDVIQDVFVEVFRSLPSFKGKSKITTWLYRVSYNVALQKIRRQSRRPEGHLTEAGDLSTDVTPIRNLEQKDAARIVYGILDTISPKKRAVFILYEIMELSSKEIAHIVEANEFTVRTRLHYARKEFYKKALQLRSGESDV